VTRNETHVHDLSTLANFKDWAQSFGAALTAFGWVQSSDTGQVNWGAIASVPAAGNYVFEIWTPGDGGTPFFIKLSYGNSGGSPSVLIQGGIGTNGTGLFVGFSTLSVTLPVAANNGATLYNCLYSGDSGSFNIMMWRDQGSTANFVICVERARTSSGATTNAYFSILTFKPTNLSLNGGTCQSIVFGVGQAPALGTNVNMLPTLNAGPSFNNINQSTFFNGNYPWIPVFPCVGYFDNPHLALGQVNQLDFSELAVVSLTILGATHSYIVSKLGNFSLAANFCIAMRWE
jgi:hypothetical protein